MENKELIQRQISAEFFPSTFLVNNVRFDDELCEVKRKAFEDALTLLESFIPKWVSVNPDKPKPDERLLFELRNGEIRYGSFLEKDQFDRKEMFVGDGFHHISQVRRYIYITLPSTGHPYELLLNHLKSSNNEK